MPNNLPEGGSYKMSYWTHVNGSIMVEDTPLTDKQIKSLFRTCSFKSPDADWEACNVPRGSEGSLQVDLNFNNDVYEACRVTMTISGALRDFYESQHNEIIDWINAIINDNDMCIRDGVLTVNEKTYRYHEAYDDNYDLIWSGFELIHDYREEN